MQETLVQFLGWENPLEKGQSTHSNVLRIPDGSDGKESTYNAVDIGSIPGLGRSPGGEHSNPPQYSCLENPMNRGAWWATVHGVTKVRHDRATKHSTHLANKVVKLK